MLGLSQAAMEALDVEARKAGISVEGLIGLICARKLAREAAADLDRALDAVEGKIAASRPMQHAGGNVVEFKRRAAN